MGFDERFPMMNHFIPQGYLSQCPKIRNHRRRRIHRLEPRRVLAADNDVIVIDDLSIGKLENLDRIDGLIRAGYNKSQDALLEDAFRIMLEVKPSIKQ